MMITLFSLFFILISQRLILVASDCPFIDLCFCNRTTNEVVCNGGDKNRLPPLENLPPVGNYFFINFKEVQQDAFENVTFPENTSISIHLQDIASIHSLAFSEKMKIPATSNLSVYFKNKHEQSSLSLGQHAFDKIRIKKFTFTNIGKFNGTSMFSTHCLGEDAFVENLIFEQCSLTGFYPDNRLRLPIITGLHIQKCPLFRNLTRNNLPTIPSAKILEISETGLEFIEENALEGWKYIFSDLIIKNNKNLKVFPAIVAGVFFDLKTLDLSGNSITSIDPDYNWLKFDTTENLILNNQPKLDLFLRSRILTALRRLKTIDFSQSTIATEDVNVIKTYVPTMPLLAAINISYTNFSSDMVTQLLTIISNSANQTVNVDTLGHKMNDTDFCSYYQVFQNAPNSVRIEFDRNQQCNCIIDLFYNDQNYQALLNDALPDPVCVYNQTRERCDTQYQLGLSGCSAANPDSNPDDSGIFGNIGPYAFAGIMAGLVVILIALLAAGSSFVYKVHRSRRRGTILDMDDPVDNQSIMIVEDRDEIFEESIADDHGQSSYL